MGGMASGNGGISPPRQALFIVTVFDLPATANSSRRARWATNLAGSIFHAFINEPLTIADRQLSLEDSRKLPHRSIFRDRMTLSCLGPTDGALRLMHVPEIAAPDGR
jgi:hypothetical protein